MARGKTLTDAGVAKLTPRSAPYADPEFPGHYIRVRPTGIKTFVAVARDLTGRQVWHTIGPSTLFTIGEAREKAREAIRAIREGKERTGPETFESVASEWYKRQVEGPKLITAPDIRAFLNKRLLPTWRAREF